MLWKLIIGFVATIILSLLSLELTRPPPHQTLSESHTTLESFGPLQVTWLLRNEPSLATLHAIEKPDIDTLRRSGLFEVQTDKPKETSRWLGLGLTWRAVRRGLISSVRLVTWKRRGNQPQPGTLPRTYDALTGSTP